MTVHVHYKQAVINYAMINYYSHDNVHILHAASASVIRMLYYVGIAIKHT